MVPTVSFKQGDETKGLFQRFWGLIRVQKNILINVFIASMLITLLGIIGSFYSKFLLDDIIPNILTVISLAMVILVVFKIITDFFRSLLMIHKSQNIDIPLLLGYYNRVISLPMNFFGTRKVGKIISRFNDASKIRDAINTATVINGLQYELQKNVLQKSLDDKNSKDVSYYTAICPIEETFLVNKKGENADIKNGMTAEVRIVSRRVTYFRYFLEKIDILN